ncbi:hypothetical protein BGZ65_003196, partial [Modicella reniformis]
MLLKLNGPLSAGVIEGHRAFPSFHGGLARPVRQASILTSYPNLSVADILDRYQDVNKEFLMSILNAKAKEDERKTEEERYKTEQIKLQSKQLELEMALEKRRGSPPAGNLEGGGGGGRSFVQGASSSAATGSESNNAHYSTPTSYRPTSAYPPSLPPDASPEQYPRQSHHDHSQAAAKDAADSPPANHPQGRHAYQDQGQMQPSPQSRPPFLKINTALRQSHPNQQHQPPHSSSSQRVSPQNTGPYPLPQSGSASNKTVGRHYAFPALSSSSAQSSPVTNIDYQSHIPPPLTPKDDHVSPTSILSPAPGQHHLKRKSIHHDAVMDAVRAKVLRNAAGQSHHQQQREQLNKKTSIDNIGRRRTQMQSSSPERLKRAMDTSGSSSNNGSLTAAASTTAGPKSKSGQMTSPSSSQHNSESQLDGPVNHSSHLSASPKSPSTPGSGNAGSGRSRSCSPPPAAVAASDATSSTRTLRKETQIVYSRMSAREHTRGDPISSGEDERTSPRYAMDRTRTDRSSEIG